MTKQVLIGIPTYSGADDLLPSCLQAIKDRTDSSISYNLVVVDDSGKTTHQQKSKLIAEKFDAKWIANDGNKGITSSWNTLTNAGKEQNIVLLNDDIIVSQGWLKSMMYFIDHNPTAGAVGLGFYFITMEDLPELLASPTAIVKPRHYATKQHLTPEEDPHLGKDHKGVGRPGRMMCAPGCSFGFSREKYDLVGGFDENMKQFYNESDFGTALAAKGFPSYVAPWPLLWHIWSATFARSPELLRGHDPIHNDRQAYIKKWGGDFAYTDPLFMSKIASTKIKWLMPYGEEEEAI